MKTAASRARWAISFADLCLLLLGFLLILQARPNAHRFTGGVRSAFSPAHPSIEAGAQSLFEPGEAILNDAGRHFIVRFLVSAGNAPILVASSGTDTGTERFDGWELAAARTAAIARALTGNGIPESRITMQMDRANGGGQRVSLETR